MGAWNRRPMDRKAAKHAFHPRVDQQLESRQLLAAGLLLPPDQSVETRLLSVAQTTDASLANNSNDVLSASARNISAESRSDVQAASSARVRRKLLKPLPPQRNKQPIDVQVRQSGRIIEVTDSDREHYFIGVLGPGIVRVLPDKNGLASIIIDGSTEDTELLIEPRRLVQPIQQEQDAKAHLFSPGQTRQDGIIRIGDIIATTGKLGAISAFRTARLAGRVEIGSTQRVERIAFQAIDPGGSIRVGGDLNTLDVLNDVILNGPTNQIIVGRDLNLFNASNVILRNGASITIGRSIGKLAQPAKGSGTGANVLAGNQPERVAGDPVITLLGGYIKGNLGIDNLSRIYIGQGREPGVLPVVVEGTFIGYERVFVNRIANPINTIISNFTGGHALIDRQLPTGASAVINNTVLGQRTDIIVRGNTPDTPTSIFPANLNLSQFTGNPIFIVDTPTTNPETNQGNGTTNTGTGTGTGTGTTL